MASSGGHAADVETSSRRRLLVVGLPLVVLLIIVGLVVYFVSQSRAARAAEIEEQNRLLRSAQEKCTSRVPSVGSLGDGGFTLVIDTKGEDELEGDSYDDLTCVLDQIEMPSNIRNDLGETRAMDGRQEATWDRITAAWRYHPDTGINISLTLEPVAE